MRRGVDELNDEVRTKAGIHSALAGRQLDIARPFLPCQNSAVISF